MKRRIIRLTIGAMIGFFAIRFWNLSDGRRDFTFNEPPRPVADANSAICELRLSGPESISIANPRMMRCEITNVSKSSITLVSPGDGSHSHWRTPLIGWSVLSVDSNEEHPETSSPLREAGCGNINALKFGEVFNLKSGRSKSFELWCLFDGTFRPGRYRVVFYYVNQPGRKWSGVPLGIHNRLEMYRVRHSTPVTAQSNELIVQVSD